MRISKGCSCGFFLIYMTLFSPVSYGDEHSAPIDEIETAIQTARDPSKGPEKWTYGPADFSSPRYESLQSLGSMKDAFDRTEPVFRELIGSASEDPIFRNYAMEALSNVGPQATPLLKELTGSPDPEIRFKAHNLIGFRIGMDHDRVAMEEYFRQVVKDDPFDPKVGHYLSPTSAP